MSWLAAAACVFEPPTVSTVFTMRHAAIGDSGAVAALVERCHEADGRSPLSEFKELRVPVANGTRTLVAASASGALEALAVAAWHPLELGENDGYWAAELVVDPDRRSIAAYQYAFEALRNDIGAGVSLWTFDDDQAAAAGSCGLVEVRAVVEMQRSLPAATSQLPDGYALRPFVEGVDEGEWIALNQRVFAHHPEAGAIDSADLALRMAQPWFDPGGLLLLSYQGAAAGYNWTKIHGDGIGEIYMIGLVPEHRGRGLAKPLTGAGLEFLTDAGAQVATLFAESDNEVALALYGSMGFEVQRRVALYAPGPA